jgi:hypothetical protein
MIERLGNVLYWTGNIFAALLVLGCATLDRKALSGRWNGHLARIFHPQWICRRQHQA